MTLEVLIQGSITILALGGLSWFFKLKFDNFDKRLDHFELKLDDMRDRAEESNKETAVRLARFDEHSRTFDMLRDDLKAQERAGWDLDKRVSKIFSILDRAEISKGIHKDKKD